MLSSGGSDPRSTRGSPIIDYSLGEEFTFKNSKKLPIYNWFYYKEGFSPYLIDKLLKYKKSKSKILFDPFMGVGTSLLRAKELNMDGFGIDISPLSYLITKVKTENYSKEEKEEIIKRLESLKKNSKEGELINFELFDLKKAFPPSNLKFILSAKDSIYRIEEEKTRNFLMVCLLSIIPQTSFIVKDGGFLRINKRKKTLNAKNLFFKKAKKMIREAKECGIVPKIKIGDAKELAFYPNDFFTITSPPYVNAVDYSKVYGIELALIGEKANSLEMISSSVFKKKEPISHFEEYSYLPIVQYYLRDMKRVIENHYKKEAELFIDVSNAVIHNNHIEIDLELEGIMREYGYKTEVIVGKVRKTRIDRTLFSVRESVVHGFLK